MSRTSAQTLNRSLSTILSAPRFCATQVTAQSPRTLSPVETRRTAAVLRSELLEPPGGIKAFNPWVGRKTGNAPCQVGLRRYELLKIASAGVYGDRCHSL
jgi:hypothetical protein